MTRETPAMRDERSPSTTPDSFGRATIAPKRRPGLPLRALRLTLVLVVAIVAVRMGGCAERLFYVPTREPTPAPRGFAGARVIRFESRDGTRLCGWFIPAMERAGSSGGADAGGSGVAPTIVHVHGNAGSMNSHIGMSDFLPRAGFNLFIFDFRGYGESEGSARRRAELIEDCHAALDATLALSEVDRARVGVFGQSLGAALAASLVADRSEIRCAVFESPFSSWRFAGATALGGSDPGWLSRFLAWMLIDDSFRPDEQIARVQVPILVIHGDADRIVPIVHGRMLRDAAPDRVTLVEFKGGDHNTLGDTHPESRRAAIDFLRANLGR